MALVQLDRVIGVVAATVMVAILVFKAQAVVVVLGHRALTQRLAQVQTVALV